MFNVPDAVIEAYLGSHEMNAQCVVLRGPQNLGTIPIIGAEIYATYGTQGGRDGRITVPRSVIDAGLLDPLSDQVVISTGIPGLVDVPLFTGRVDVRSANSTGDVRVRLESRGVEAIRAAFEVPWAAGPAGTRARQEMLAILQNVDSSWGVDISAANTNTIGGGLVWEDSRGQALDQLAKGASLIWQPDRTGGFTIYTNPYAVGPILGAGVRIFLRDGVGGVTTRVENTESREGVYNSVTVVTERTGNVDPLRVTVRDVGASSPTMWGGLFGKQNLVVKSQTPISLTDAQQLALRILRQSLAMQRSFTISLPDMPLLDPGDVFALIYRGVTYTLVAESIAYSFDAKQDTVIQARELLLIDVDEVA